MKDYFRMNISRWLAITVIFVMVAGMVPQELFACNPPPGCFYGEIRSMGFWKNHLENYVLPQDLGCNEIIDTPEKAVAIFENASAEEMSNMLKAQLLAMKFNIAYFGIGEYIAQGQTQSFNNIADQADGLLCNSAPREEMESMKNLLDYLNNVQKFIYCPEIPEIPGCKDPEANNYNSNATVDDGSCKYDILGCTDQKAKNYNPDANVDDGSCHYDILGCMDPEALNYDPNATIDDGSCNYCPSCPCPPCPECPNRYSISGKKFNDVNKNGKDNSEPGIEGWAITLTDSDQILSSATTSSEGAFLFSDLEAETYTVCEGSKTNWTQTYPTINNGCHVVTLTNSNVENIKFGNYYQEPSTPISGCTDQNALNYNSQATVNDGSCQYHQGGGGGGGSLSAIGGSGSSGKPGLKIEKTINEEFTNPGGIITFVVEIENTASGMAYNVALKDILPQGFNHKDTDSSNREWVLGYIDGWSKRTITYQVKVSDNVEPGIYTNTAELSAINHETISDDAQIDVRKPIILGEEVVVEKPEEPEPEKDVLPHTGVNDFIVYLLLSFAVLISGILGLLSIFAKKHKQVIQIFLFAFLIFGSLIALSYPLWPLISYEVKETSSDNSEIILAQAETEELKIQGNYLIIPKIGVEMPIVQGEDDSALERGAWLMPESSTPDLLGNTVLAGHRFKYKPPHKETFYLLDKLEAGDLLQIFWQGKEYRYAVVSSEVVLPEQVEILAPTEKPTLTLITCHPLFSDKKRLVVRGELI